MNFTNEEIILENEIKRKDTLKIKYKDLTEAKPIRNVVKLLGSNMIVLTNNKEEA